MKWEPNPSDVVSVTCTDTEKTLQGEILNRSHDKLRVVVQGIPLQFYKLRPRIYVANMSGMEFVIKL